MNAIELSKNNKAALQSVKRCSCYFCLRVFDSSEVVEYTDDETALCPHCGIDAILPGVTDIEVLKAAHEEYFCKH